MLPNPGRQSVQIPGSTIQACTTPAADQAFTALVMPTLGGTEQATFTERESAGEAVHHIIEQVAAAAIFQRAPITAIIGAYRGLDLVVRTHHLWQPDLALQSPTGHRIGDINAATASGIWQSATRLINGIANDMAGTAQRIIAHRARIATIDQELTRLATWDGQVAYDTAVAELAAIITAFAVADEAAQAGAQATAAAPATDAPGTDTTTTLHAATIAAVLALQSADDAGPALIVTIPPALASLAWMEAQRSAREPMDESPDAELNLDAREQVADLPQSIEPLRQPRTPTRDGAAGSVGASLRPPARAGAFTQLPLF